MSNRYRSFNGWQFVMILAVIAGAALVAIPFAMLRKDEDSIPRAEAQSASGQGEFRGDIAHDSSEPASPGPGASKPRSRSMDRDPEKMAQEHSERHADKRLWSHPAPGSPISPHGFLGGSQILIRLLPGEWHAREEWQRVMRVFDPAWQRVNDEFRRWTDISLAEVRELYLSFRVSHAGGLEACVFMELFPESRVPERWQGAERFQIVSVSREQTTWSTGPFVSVLQSSPVQLILGSRDALHDFLQDRPQHPLLRREVERLRANSSDASHLTVFFIPTFVVQHGRELVSSAWQPVISWLDETLGDGVRAASLSVWIDDVEAFAELRLIPTWEACPEVCSRLPQALEAVAQAGPRSYSTGDDPSLRWRPLRERFQTMRRFAFEQVRWSQERDQLVVNVSLPAEAMHNLLLGTELTFREALWAQP